MYGARMGRALLVLGIGITVGFLLAVGIGMALRRARRLTFGRDCLCGHGMEWHWYTVGCTYLVDTSYGRACACGGYREGH